MATRQQLEQALQHPNVIKMLNLIAQTEGVKHGYNTLFGNQRLESLNSHPNIRKRFTQTDGKTNVTTAAGRYQFLTDTWNNVARQYGLKDFGARTQDLGAVGLIAGRGALNDVINGNWQNAIRKLGPEWASLPSSNYKQNKRSWDFVNKFLGSNVGQNLPQNAQTLFYGDSIANGYRQSNKGQGFTQDGASPQLILRNLQQTLGKNANAFKGQNVVLSSGYSNNVNDLKAIEQQMLLLKNAGANVQLLGVSNQYNLHGQNGGAMNTNLQNLSKKYGASFLGGFDAGQDRVHPSNYNRNFGGQLQHSQPPQRQLWSDFVKQQEPKRQQWSDFVKQSEQPKPQRKLWSDFVKEQQPQAQIQMPTAQLQQIQPPQRQQWSDFVKQQELGNSNV